MLTEEQINLLLEQLKHILYDLGRKNKRTDIMLFGITMKAYLVGKNIRIDIIPKGDDDTLDQS